MPLLNQPLTHHDVQSFKEQKMPKKFFKSKNKDLPAKLNMSIRYKQVGLD